MKDSIENNSIENLYLIGNGFDIHHKIKCRYSDFHEWLYESNPILENRLFQVYDLHHGDLWASLETNLGEITTESILEGYVYGPMLLFISQGNNKPIALSMDEYTENVSEVGYTLKRLYDDLQVEFAKWILQLEDAIPKYKVKIEKSNTLFINFNYTQTLENVYGVQPSNILYIHGCVATNEDLIFGHNKTSEKLLKEWDENKYSEEELATLIEAANEIAVLYKDVNEIIRKNASFWKKIQNIKRIHVWGLSLSEIDVPYIKHIDIGVTEHFGYILNADSIGQTDRCSIRVTGSVCGQVLLYLAQVGNLFQVAVHLLIAGDRQQYSFLFAGRIICIFSQDFQRNIQ